MKIAIILSGCGNRDGSETVQIYVHEENPCVPRPVRELKGFCKVSIPKGQARTVTVHLPREAFAYYDSDSHGWVVNPGAFTIEAGASAADIRTAIPVVLE